MKQILTVWVKPIFSDNLSTKKYFLELKAILFCVLISMSFDYVNN